MSPTPAPTPLDLIGNERPPGDPLPPVEEIRDLFPALRRTQAGMPVAYFDGPGGTQVPQPVIEAVRTYLVEHNANTHWEYASSRETDEVIEAGRGALADLVGGRPEEIVFGANMTSLTFHLARALGRGWGEGDEIVVTELDHHANVAPWEALIPERGVVVRTLAMDPRTGRLELDRLPELMGPKTRLVAVGLASNAIGTVNDVRDVVEIARSVGALTFVDAVHAAAHLRIDVASLDCDFLSCSAYKFYGPHIGVLWGRHGILEDLDVPRLAPAPNQAPERVETGTQNHEGIAGAQAAVDFLAGLGRGDRSEGSGAAAEAQPGAEPRSGRAAAASGRRVRLDRALTGLHRRGESLMIRLWSGLRGIRGVELYGPAPGEPRTPTVAFRVAGVPSDRVAARLSSELGIFVSHGDFYAATVIERLGAGPDGVVRAGCACYTTESEVDRLVTGVEEIASGRLP